MSLLSDDFFDNWVDWKIELYASIANFAADPSEINHDAVVNVLKNQAGSEVERLHSYPSSSKTPVIAICNSNRKRDALAIQGPISYFGKIDHSHTRTWKCSKHTPQHMRSQWVDRKFSPTGSGLYINRTPKFEREHEIFKIPMEVYEALTTQFKQIDYQYRNESI